MNGRMEFGRIFIRGEDSSSNFIEVGARPGIRERRNGPARGIFNCLVAHDPLSGKQMLSEVQWCLNALRSPMVFGSSPVDLFGRGDTDEDLLIAQDSSSSGQFVL